MARHSDALFHPVFLDPRHMAALNPYDETPPAAQKPTEAPANETRSRDFDIKHIRLALSVDPSDNFVEGTATLRLTSFRDGLETLELDASELNVREVLQGRRRLRFESYREKLLVTLESPLRRGRSLTLQIAYSARPRRGLYFVRPDESYPDKPLQVWSQGEAEDNHAWFPCTDSPNQRQTSETIISVPERFIVLSNGVLVSEKHDRKRQRKTFHWRQDEPHPTYLVSVVVGVYEELRASASGSHSNGLPITYYTYPGTAADARRLMGRTPEMIRHFSRLFGHPYPFAKYAQVVVDDYIYGAMENTSATTHSDRFLHDEVTELDFNCHDVVAHELAHQWWGDLLTPRSWKHLWLKESFATYAEALWLEHAQGEREARQMLIQEFNTYLSEDRDRYRRPIVYDRYDFPMDIFDRHAYQKGALVLGMLRYVLGDDDFFRTLQHYAQKHRWQSVETNDLKVAIEEATGRNLDWFFDEWLYARGYPEFEVSHAYQSASRSLKVNVRQTQRTDDGTPLFRMPVRVEVIGRRGPITFPVIIEKQEQELHFTVGERPLCVLFDAGDHILKTLRHEKSRQELLYQLRSVAGFTARMRAARDLAAFKDEEVVANLRRAVLQDEAAGVRMSAAVALSEIASTSAREALIAGLKRNREARVRRAVCWALGRFRGDKRAVAALTRTAHTDASYFVAAFAMRALAHAAREEAHDTLIGMLSRASYQDVLRATVFDALAIARDSRGVALAVDHTAYGVPPSVRVAAVAALASLGKEHAEERERVFHRLAELLEDKAFRVRLAAVKAFGVLEDERAIPYLRAVDEREAVHVLRSAARASLRTLEEKAKKREEHGKEEK